MESFSYGDYIKSIHTLNLHSVMKLTEEDTKYNIRKNSVKEIYVNLIKKILKDKKEMRKFINGFLEPKHQVKDENFIMLEEKFLINQELEVLYKLKNRDVFYFIKCIDIEDKNFEYKILNTCIEIIKQWKFKNKIKKTKGQSEFDYPIIIPIVIYMGNINDKIKNQNEKYKKENHLFIKKINIKYNLVELHKYSKNVLVHRNDMISYLTIIKNSIDKNTLIDNFEIMLKKDDNKHIIIDVTNMIIHILDKAFKDTVSEKYMISEKMEVINMESLFNRILNENRIIFGYGVKEGRKRETEKIARNMVKMGFEENIVLNITKIRKEELEKIREKDM